MLNYVNPMRRTVGGVLMRRAVGAVCTNSVSSLLHAPRIIVLPVEAMPSALLRYAIGPPPICHRPATDTPPARAVGAVLMRRAVGAVCTDRECKKIKKIMIE